MKPTKREIVGFAGSERGLTMEVHKELAQDMVGCCHMINVSPGVVKPWLMFIACATLEGIQILPPKRIRQVAAVPPWFNFDPYPG